MACAGRRLVVFGCGYVGSAVALRAAAQGWRVTALTRNPASAVVLREQDIETVVADLAGTEWHDAIAGAPEFALNCVSSGGSGLAGYRRSYVDGMRSILEWAKSHGAMGTLVYTSSTSVYPQSGGVTVDESAPVQDAAADESARLLVAAEDELRQSGAAASRWFILRLAGIYGPGRHHVIEQVRSGEVSGRPDVHLNLVHRDDIVAAVEACFAAPAVVANEIFNVVDDEPARKAEVVAWLAQRLGAAAPQYTGRPAGGRRTLTPDRLISNRKLRTTLGWKPRYPTFRDGYASLLGPAVPS